MNECRWMDQWMDWRIVRVFIVDSDKVAFIFTIENFFYYYSNSNNTSLFTWRSKKVPFWSLTRTLLTRVSSLLKISVTRQILHRSLGNWSSTRRVTSPIFILGVEVFHLRRSRSVDKYSLLNLAKKSSKRSRVSIHEVRRWSPEALRGGRVEVEVPVNK